MNEHKVVLFILAAFFYCLYTINVRFKDIKEDEEQPPKPELEAIVEKQPEVKEVKILKPNISRVKYEAKKKAIPLYQKDACSALEVFMQKPRNFTVKRDDMPIEDNAITVIGITVFLFILVLNAFLDVLKVREEQRARLKLNPDGEIRQSLAEFANKRMLRRESSKFGQQLSQIAESVMSSDEDNKSRRETRPYTRGESTNSYLSEKPTKTENSAPASIGEMADQRSAKRQSAGKLFGLSDD